jgi:hypothetical protein
VFIRIQYSKKVDSEKSDRFGKKGNNSGLFEDERLHSVEMAEHECVSNVELDGEWKTRKISLMGVVRSFVSQLRPGQDLTRVSLPAVMLYPYSMLEVFAFRYVLASIIRASIDCFCQIHSFEMFPENSHTSSNSSS